MKVSANTLPRNAIIAAQLLILLALVLGLNFMHDTNGGSLLLYASLSPILIFIAISILVAVGIYRYRASHTLFEIETYKPGETVFQQGDPGDCAYFIHDGKVEVLKDHVVIATLAKDQYFGEMALLSSGARNATIRAVENTQVAVLGKSNFLRLLAVLPATKEDILKTVQSRAMQADKSR